MKSTFILIFAIFFLGCSFTQEPPKQSIKTVQKPILTKPKLDNPSQKKKQRSRAISGMLRGVITSQKFNKTKKLWVYSLKVIDIANDSLKEVEFLYKTRVLDNGDLVYVLFDDKNKEFAKDIFLIKKEYVKIDKNRKESSNTNKFKKRTKARQTPWIGLPKVSTIKLK